jgi:ABC-type ATPase involved in cell division
MKKGILVLNKKAVEKISEFKLSTIRVEVKAIFDKSRFGFSITVYDEHSDNLSFYFYHFQKLEELKKRLTKVTNNIKLDDFSKLKKLVKELA